MSDPNITNEQISDQIEELTKAVADGFARLERQDQEIASRMGVLEAQHSELVTRIKHIPENVKDEIEETYGRTINDLVDRVHDLEKA